MTTQIPNLVITLEKDVPQTPVKRRRGIDDTDPVVQKLRTMDIGDSFFTPGVVKKDLRAVVDLGRKLGLYLMARDMECDPIYQTQGVRIWREEKQRRGKALEHEAPAVQSGKTASKIQYWDDEVNRAVYKTMPGVEHNLDLEELVEIGEDEYIRLDAEYNDM